MKAQVCLLALFLLQNFAFGLQEVAGRHYGFSSRLTEGQPYYTIVIDVENQSTKGELVFAEDAQSVVNMDYFVRQLSPGENFKTEYKINLRTFCMWDAHVIASGKKFHPIFKTDGQYPNGNFWKGLSGHSFVTSGSENSADKSTIHRVKDNSEVKLTVSNSYNPESNVSTLHVVLTDHNIERDL